MNLQLLFRIVELQGFRQALRHLWQCNLPGVESCTLDHADSVLAEVQNIEMTVFAHIRPQGLQVKLSANDNQFLNIHGQME
jgi:hypothetical protein